MNRRTFLGASVAASLMWAQGRKRPNILIFLADDMGFADLGCYGSEVQTPNIDGLAKRGVRFRQFYNAARCCPTRASVLTGLYQHQAGIGHMVANWGKPGYEGALNGKCVTIAEVLREAGYGTYISGKWHVTHAQRRDALPLQRGFDRFYGTLAGGGNYYFPNGLMQDNESIRAPEQGYFYTDAIGDHAVEFLRGHAEKRGADPFFLYLPFTAPHWPLHALEPEIAKYRAVFREGWDNVRMQRHKRQVAMGLLPPTSELAPRDASVPSWSDAPDKDWEVERMSVYAAQIDRMDQNVGRVLKQVAAMGAKQNTLVLFLSDNGSSAEIIRDTPANWRHTPWKVNGGNKADITPGGRDTFQSCGPSWAQVSNTPFRRYKMWVHEGGISTPLIASWPGRVRKVGGFVEGPGHITDIMATCCDAAGVKYPSTYQGRAITPTEGRSLLPLFEGRASGNGRTLFWEHEGNQAIRQGKWKLVRANGQPWELFDMDTDRTEVHDLAARQPAVVARLEGEYQAWMKRVGALPYAEARAGAKQGGGE